MHLILLYALQYFYLFYVTIGASCISTHDMNPIIIKNERKEKSRNPVFGGQNFGKIILLVYSVGSTEMICYLCHQIISVM